MHVVLSGFRASIEATNGTASQTFTVRFCPLSRPHIHTPSRAWSHWRSDQVLRVFIYPQYGLFDQDKSEKYRSSMIYRTNENMLRPNADASNIDRYQLIRFPGEERKSDKYKIECYPIVYPDRILLIVLEYRAHYLQCCAFSLCCYFKHSFYVHAQDLLPIRCGPRDSSKSWIIRYLERDSSIFLLELKRR